MSEETLHDDIRQLRDQVAQILSLATRTDTNFESLERRLFNGVGFVPTANARFEKIEKDVQKAQKAAEESSTSLRLHKAYIAGYAACAAMFGTALAFAGRYLLTKLGFHI